jgi:chromosome partitioning protein
VKKVIACYSSKGGVGKTAAAVNLAYAAAAAGRQTLLVDLDGQGAAGFYFRIRPRAEMKATKMMGRGKEVRAAIRASDYPGLDLLPAHRSYRRFDALLESMTKSRRRLADLVSAAGRDYDVVILDCPPTLSHVAENIFRAADVILVPVVPTTLSRRTFDELRRFFEKKHYRRRKLRPFFSMVEKRKRLHCETMAEMSADGAGFCEACIPYCTEIELMGTHREPVLATAPRRRGALAFAALWAEIDSDL